MNNNYYRYSVKYHLVWCPKPKLGGLFTAAEDLLKDILYTICSKYRYEIHSLEINADFIHIFLSVDPSVAPADIMRTLKSLSAVHLLRRVPEMRTFYGRQGSLWEKGYLISTSDTLDKELLRQFLKDLLF